MPDWCRRTHTHLWMIGCCLRIWCLQAGVGWNLRLKSEPRCPLRNRPCCSFSAAFPNPIPNTEVNWLAKLNEIGCRVSRFRDRNSFELSPNGINCGLWCHFSSLLQMNGFLSQNECDSEHEVRISSSYSKKINRIDIPEVSHKLFQSIHQSLRPTSAWYQSPRFHSAISPFSPLKITYIKWLISSEMPH